MDEMVGEGNSWWWAREINQLLYRTIPIGANSPPLVIGWIVVNQEKGYKKTQSFKWRTNGAWRVFTRTTSLQQCWSRNIGQDWWNGFVGGPDESLGFQTLGRHTGTGGSRWTVSAYSSSTADSSTTASSSTDSSISASWYRSESNLLPLPALTEPYSKDRGLGGGLTDSDVFYQKDMMSLLNWPFFRATIKKMK